MIAAGRCELVGGSEHLAVPLSADGQHPWPTPPRARPCGPGAAPIGIRPRVVYRG